MRIAQVAPLYEAVPPRLYGGTERVVHYLTEELVRKGHQVTLFATADSTTKANLVANVKEGLRLSGSLDPLVHHIVQLQEVIDRANEFDVIHFHTDYLHFPFSNGSHKATVTTLHGRLDLPDLQAIYNKFSLPVVSISYNQRKPVPQANWAGNVYHGLPTNLFHKGEGNDEYLAFIGRISPEKGPDKAIAIAKKAGIKIKIAAKIDKADLDYFNNNIRPLFDDPLVEYIGEINERQKQEFLGNSIALLFPIDWCEPFGMVMIEAMACGTPVIAFSKGSVPEIVLRGTSGYVINTLEEAVDAVNNIQLISRDKVRKYFEERFTADRMADDYLKIYRHAWELKKQQQQEESLLTTPAVSIDPTSLKMFQ